MNYTLITVLLTLALVNVCFGDSEQISSTSTGDRSVEFTATEHEVEPLNVTFNCSYVAKDNLFVNLTISKDKTVFYSFNSTTLNAPKFTSIDGIDNITRKAPGIFVVENVTKVIEGNYSCNVYFNSTQTQVVSNLSTSLHVHFTSEAEIAKQVLELLNETVQGALELSNQLHQLTKGKNETLKQELLNEIDSVLKQYRLLPTDSELEQLLKTVPLVERYFIELGYANFRLVVKYANLAKVEVQKH